LDAETETDSVVPAPRVRGNTDGVPLSFVIDNDVAAPPAVELATVTVQLTVAAGRLAFQEPSVCGEAHEIVGVCGAEVITVNLCAADHALAARVPSLPSALTQYETPSVNAVGTEQDAVAPDATKGVVHELTSVDADIVAELCTSKVTFVVEPYGSVVDDENTGEAEVANVSLPTTTLGASVGVVAVLG
jgi:hypothetical protein